MPTVGLVPLDCAPVMAGEVKLGRGQSLDDALLEAAVLDLSAEEISRRLGGIMSPARVILRVKELLRSNDWLEEAERERALLRILQQRVAELQRASDLDSIKVQGAFVKELLTQLNKRQSASDEQLNTYNANVGRQLGHVVDLALSYMKGALREEVDPAKWDALVQEALAMARHEIESKQIEEK